MTTSVPTRRARLFAALPSFVRSTLSRFWLWLPASITRSVRGLAWASLVLQVVLIGTGGAVRLTASGLGCPTWPSCTAGSFVNTPEMGIHGIIEFSNRMLTFVLSVVVIAVFLAVLRFRKERPDLFRLTLIQGLSIPFQAVLGGITVLTGLNPYVVGAHFAVSIVLVVVTAILVYRVYNGRRGSRSLAPSWYRIVTGVATLFAGVTVIFGILTTGSGPHAGDNSNASALAPRNGLDPELLQHIHSYPAYILFGLTVFLAIAAVARRRVAARIATWTSVLLAVEVVQIVVGVSQANLGLPIVLVGIHMILAGILIAVVTVVLLSLRSTRAQDDAVRGASAADATESVRA